MDIGKYVTLLKGPNPGPVSSDRVRFWVDEQGRLQQTTSAATREVGSNALAAYTVVSDNSYTLLESDLGKIIYCSNETGCTITVPEGLGEGFNCGVFRAEGAVDFTVSGDPAAVSVSGDTEILSQYGIVSLLVLPDLNVLITGNV